MSHVTTDELVAAFDWLHFNVDGCDPPLSRDLKDLAWLRGFMAGRYTPLERLVIYARCQPRHALMDPYPPDYVVPARIDVAELFERLSN